MEENKEAQVHFDSFEPGKEEVNFEKLNVDNFASAAPATNVRRVVDERLIIRSL